MMITEVSVIEPETTAQHSKALATTAWITNPYIQAATSDHTRKAYQSDIRHFEQWGGLLPATSEIVVHYLQSFAGKLNPRTLSRRLTALKNWHQYQGLPDPTQHPAITKTLTGITRVHGKPKEKARALTPDELLAIVSVLQQPTLLNLRDNALLQIGFFGAFRRSELVAIQVDHIHWYPEGIEIVIPRSKTDPLNEGQSVALPYGPAALCPVQALKRWLEAANLNQGPLFRRLQKEKIGEAALTPLSVNHVLQKRAKQANLHEVKQLSSHSLRRGFASSASQLGANMPAIMRQGRWKQVNTVMEYIEMGDRFSENAANNILKGSK